VDFIIAYIHIKNAMKTLFVIRHAKSSWENPDIDDMVRPLNQRGKESTILLGNWLKNHKIKPDYFISSPATRALHTAINIASWIYFNKAKIDIDASIYFGGTKAIIDKLLSLDKLSAAPESVFIVGHEPYLGELVQRLTKDELEKFPTCAMYRIHWDAATWAEAMQMQGSKVDFITPKMLLN